MASECVFLKEVWVVWRHYNCRIGDTKIRRYLCLINKLLASIAVARAETKWRRSPWTWDPCIKLLCLGSTSCLIKLESYWRHIWEMYLQVNRTFRIFVLVNTATVVLRKYFSYHCPGNGAFHFLSITPPPSPLYGGRSPTPYLYSYRHFLSLHPQCLWKEIF